MPLVRFKIRNELSLGAPELNRSAAVENEEPKAILSAVEVAGLVGILRQLGDLAEFSAEVFNGIQEEVTVTASRCQKLTSRVKRIESALSPLEKAVLSQTSHIHFAYTSGCEWHPRIRNGQRHFVQSDLPLFVMETYEQCRDPPPLHLLDRFDSGGPGSCLRKYSDPTFFRKELGNPSKVDDVKVQRDQAHRKRKKKRLPQRNICRSRAVSTSDETNGAGLSSLTDDRHSTSQSTSTVDMPRSSNMQDLSDIVDQSHLQGQSDMQEQSEAQVQSGFPESSKARDSITGSGYIEYVINQSPDNKPDVKLLEGFLSSSLQPADRKGSAVPEGCIEVVDDNILYSPSEDKPVPCASIGCNEKKETHELMMENGSKDEKPSEINDSKFGPGTPDRERQYQRDFDRTHIFFDEVDIVGEKQSKSQANCIDGKLGFEDEGENISEQGSEADEFVDARNTIESESESEVDSVPKPNLEHYFGDISTYCSEDANSDNNDGSEDTLYEQMAPDPGHANSLDESCSRSYFPEDANVFCSLPDQVCEKTVSHEETFHSPREPFATCPSSLDEEAFLDETILQEEPVAAPTLLAEDCANENISFDELISSGPSLDYDVPSQKILPEEHLDYYESLSDGDPHEKILPGECVAGFSSFEEIIPYEEILPEKSLPKVSSSREAVPGNMTPVEEPDAAHPSFPKTVQEQKISTEVLDTKNLSVTEGVSQEQVSLEDFVAIYPCVAEAVPDKRLLTEEPEEYVTTCMYSSKVMPSKNLSPEKPLEALHNLSELPQETILSEKTVESRHPPCEKATFPEEYLSPGVLDSKYLSLPEAVSQEQISLEEFVGIHPCSGEAVPDERFLTEESVTTFTSSEKDMSFDKLLPEKTLEAHDRLSELPRAKILPEKTADFAHPPCDKVASPEENLSAEVLDSTDVSVVEIVPQEQIRLEELAGGDPCLAKAVPDERVLSEEPVTTSLSMIKAVAVEKVLPEELLETNPSLSKLPEEKVSHEVTDSLEESLSQEQISLEEFVGIDPCLVDAVPDEGFLPEELVTTCPSLKKDAPVEGCLPEKPLEAYPSLAELPEEKILCKEADDATHPSVSQAVTDEQISPEVLDSTNFRVAAALPQKQILREEFVSRDPCTAETVPNKRWFLEEPVTICRPLTKLVPNREVLPEKSVEPYTSLEKSPKDEILQENSDDGSHPSCAKAESDDDNVSAEVLDSEILSMAEAIPLEKIALEEFVIDPCFSESVPDERVLPEEPDTICMQTKLLPIKEVLQEEHLEAYASSEKSPKDKIFRVKSDDGTLLSYAGAESEEIVSPEVLDSKNLSLAEAIPHENIAVEEFVSIGPCFSDVVRDEGVFPEEPVITCMSSTKDGPIEKILPEEPLEMHPYPVELPEENISQEEQLEDATYPSFSEAAGEEKISPLERRGSYPDLEEFVIREKISHEELVGTNPFLEVAVPNVNSFPDEPDVTYQSLAEAVSMEKNLLEETLPTYPSLAEAVPDEHISGSKDSDATCPPYTEAFLVEKTSGSEALGYTTEAGPHNPEEPVATDMSVAEAGSDEKMPGSESSASVSETPASTTETGLHNKTFPDEPVATCLSLVEPVPEESDFPKEPAPVLPKEPAAKYLDLAEGVPDQQVFLDDAAFLSFAEAIFDQKFSPEVPDSTYPSLAEPEMARSLVTESADRTISPSDGSVTVSPDAQGSLSNGTVVESVSIWSNGGLLGLAPSKPPVFAEPKSVSEHIQNDINENNVLASRKEEVSSRSVEDTEESSLSLVVSDPTSQQQNKMSSHSNGTCSHLQSKTTSFKVFGLSHRLLMAGFRGDASSTCKFESIPTTSYNGEVAAIKDTAQQAPRGSSFEEQLDYESSLLASPASSPPVEHMRISFNTEDASTVSKLKLRIPGHANMFPTFQLVPEASNSDDDDDHSDIFCQSSPCVSDNCLSDSELWESDESPRKTISSSKQAGETSTQWEEMGSFSGSVLDLPSFESLEHQSELEQEQVVEYKPSVSEIIRDWPPNQTKSTPNTNAVLKQTQNESIRL